MSWVTTQPMTTPGSLVSLMDQLADLQSNLPAEAALASLEPLHTYRWRPDLVDPPALYNLLLPSTSSQRDTSRIRDTIIIATRIGDIYGDDTTHMREIELWADTYRALVDVNFWNGQMVPPPIKGAATWAMRNSMQSFQDNFGSTTLSGIEFVQEFWLDRHNR